MHCSIRSRTSTNESDIVALLVLEHQVNAQNAIARVNWDVRTAIDREPGAAEAAPQATTNTQATLSAESARYAAVRESIEALVQTMLFADGTVLTDEISGESRSRRSSRAAPCATRKAARCATSTCTPGCSAIH